MDDYQEDFIVFLADSGMLRFEPFTTKSGRVSPYFINSGAADDGAQLGQLGGFYADALMDRLNGEFDVLFGPAYKGIPLAIATALALIEKHDKNVAVTFDRKEAKDHGEGGTIIGHSCEPGERVVIIDDVLTAGTSVRQVCKLLREETECDVAAIMVGVDRQEKGQGDRAAAVEMAEDLHLPVIAIATIDDVVAVLRTREIDGKPVLTEEVLAAMDDYRARYGPRAG